MKIILLGTNGYHPNNRRHTSCIMLPEVGVVLDAGTGMFRVREHLQTSRIDIFVTHAHLDHVVGLTYIFDLLHESKLKHAVVHGAADKLAAIENHLFAELLFPVKPPLEMEPLAGSFDLPEQGKLIHFPLVHPGGSLGYRLDWQGRSMAYVTDTTAVADADYVEQIHGVDLLIHECNFPDGLEEFAAKTGHSCTSAVAQVARSADVGRLVLVHLNPLSESDDPIGIDVARAIFPKTDLGFDGMELTL